MPWIDWPLAERNAGKGLDYDPAGPSGNMYKWVSRDDALRDRCIPGSWRSGDINVGSNTLGVWYASGLASDQLWIPPWAYRLTIRVKLDTNSTSDIFGSALSGAIRPSIGSVALPVVTIRYETKWKSVRTGSPPDWVWELVSDGPATGADGVTGAGGSTWTAKESAIVVPDAWKNTIQTLTYEVLRSTSLTTTVKLSNDVAAKTYRPWYFSEV